MGFLGDLDYPFRRLVTLSPVFRFHSRMTTLRVGLLVVGGLVLGFAAGWQLHQPLAANQAITPVATPTNAVAAFATPRPNVGPPRPAAETVAAFHPVVPSVTERLTTVRWLQSNGLFVSLPIFNGDRVSPQFSLLYGLTPAETVQLNQASLQTRQRLDELTRQHAQLNPGSTNEKLIVTVPAFPAEGGQAFNDLVATFSTVLGTDRYATFNAISGDSLEHYFGDFGMENSRYEVTLVKTNGKESYAIQRSFTMGDGNGSGTSGSRLDAAGVAKFFPVLQSFPLPTTPSGSTQ